MTVIFPRSACRLPVELLSMVMDSVTIDELLNVSHVCAHWRAVAHSHPTYWREIRLAAVSTTALDFFHARLDHCTDRDINIIIRLADTPPSARLHSIVFPAITRHLSRVARLALDLHADVALQAIPALLEAAPRLHSLRLKFFHCSEEQPAVLLPPDLFARSSPRLVAATLSNVDFPKPPIVAFQRVDSLILASRRPRIFRTALFDHFPALQSLCMFGKSCVGTRLDSTSASLTASLATAPPLSELEVHMEKCNYDLFLSIPNLCSINIIICRRPDASTAQLLLSHLEGPLELELHGMFTSFVRVSFFSPSSCKLRSFAEREVKFPEGSSWEVLLSALLLERITTFRLHSRFAYLAHYFDKMPKCRTFVLIITGKGLPAENTIKAQSLRFPELKDVLVCTEEEHPAGRMTVAAGELHSWLLHLIGPRPSRPTLWLDGISLSGSCEAVWSDFDPQH